MRAGARFTVSPFKWSGRFGSVVWCWEGGLLFASLVFVILLDSSLDNSWIYPGSQVQGTMTATIVMMRGFVGESLTSGSISLNLCFRFSSPCSAIDRPGTGHLALSESLRCLWIFFFASCASEWQ